MDEATKLQLYMIAKSVAKLTGIQFGNVSFRIENGQPTGLIENRETIKLDKDTYEPQARKLLNEM